MIKDSVFLYFHSIKEQNYFAGVLDRWADCMLDIIGDED